MSITIEEAAEVKVEELQSTSVTLAAAIEQLEQLSIKLRGEPRLSHSDHWILKGFTDDALTDAEEIVRQTLELVAKVTPGFTGHQERLWELVTGGAPLP
jgi:hypothetical protein